MNTYQIENMASAALDAACLHIQTALGVASGDTAAAYFSDDVVLQALADYIRRELYSGLN